MSDEIADDQLEEQGKQPAAANVREETIGPAEIIEQISDLISDLNGLHREWKVLENFLREIENAIELDEDLLMPKTDEDQRALQTMARDGVSVEIFDIFEEIDAQRKEARRDFAALVNKKNLVQAAPANQEDVTSQLNLRINAVKKEIVILKSFEDNIKAIMDTNREILGNKNLDPEITRHVEFINHLIEKTEAELV